MNERIEKISEQARQYADSMYPSGLDIAKWGPAYQEKFAELIVRECVDIIDKDAELPDDIGGNAYLRMASKKIKEHFGVEE
jgi:hypothetical protein